MSSIQRNVNPEDVFEVLERLGEGSYGKVYKAVSRASADVVALKIVPLESDPDALDLSKEIAILERCRSPFVVQYFGSFVYDAHVWIAMEFCAAGSVADLLALRQQQTRQCLAEREIAAVCASVATGLAYLHTNQSIHRDIKAANILLARDGRAKLADFGVSAQLTNTVNKRKTVIGTPFWMAPEVIQESQYDGKADIWSLGITAIEMADGAPPLAQMHPMRAIFVIPTRPPPTIATRADGLAVSPAFADFVATCLQKDPAARPTATELLQHAFIARDVEKLARSGDGLAVLQELVDQSLELVAQAREYDDDVDDVGSYSPSGRFDSSLGVADVSTMVRSDTGTGTTGSIVTHVRQRSTPAREFPNSSDGLAAEQLCGTMVFCGDGNSNVAPVNDEYDDDDDDYIRARRDTSDLYGTMVPASSYGAAAPFGHWMARSSRSGTMVSGTMVSGTMVSGTMVSGTMVSVGSADCNSSAFDTLRSTGSTGTDTLQSLSSSSSKSSSSAVESDEPSFMRYFRQSRDGDDASIKCAAIRPATCEDDSSSSSSNGDVVVNKAALPTLRTSAKQQLAALDEQYERELQALQHRFARERTMLEQQMRLEELNTDTDSRADPLEPESVVV